VEDVGKPSEIALQAIERINDGSLADDGRSIWSDLPPVAREYQSLEQDQDEEGSHDGR
jgi:hypothetical protein